MTQQSIFDGTQPYKNTKPLRLISLFSGYDSQALALKYLGIPFEHYLTCEWAVKSIQALKDLHFADDNKDYSAPCSFEELVDYLTQVGISANYNEPMTKEQIKRMGEKKCRQVFNNIVATSNMVNIQQAHIYDKLDTDKYTYLMTYSFPCQDLSKAGRGAGMEKGSGTRSGMLWEVERMLDECVPTNCLPQLLLMENVPDVIGSSNIKHFAKWLEKLESLGYKCYWKVLNAKDFGVPQNRERCYMVSILGDYYYEFPSAIKLEHRLKDLLEEEVDEKYFLSSKQIQWYENSKFQAKNLDHSLPKEGIVPTLTSHDSKMPRLVEITSGQSQGMRVYDPDGLSVTLNANGGGGGAETGLYVVNSKENLKHKLCNELIRNKKVNEGDIILHSYSNNRLKKMFIQNREFHDCCSTLGTRCDCLGVVINTKNKSPQKLAENLSQCRIRKLTPKECFRLMGVHDEDFEKVAKNQSNASLYHLAGDSIVVDVLVAIFKNLFK